MTAAKSNAVAEPRIRALIDNRIKAVRAKDVNRAASNLAPDLLSFDVVKPLQRIGVDRSRRRAEKWFGWFQSPIGYEIRDLSITAGDDLAFSHSLNRYSGTKTDQGKIDMGVRATVCYRKIGGKWMVAHAHQSVPFDAQSGKASLDLRP